MSEHSAYNGLHLMVAFLTGAAAGAAIAWLGSSEEGRQTRERLRDLAKDAGSKAVLLPEALRSAGGRAATAARDAFEEAMKPGLDQ
jgi:gas vesicle protein